MNSFTAKYTESPSRHKVTHMTAITRMWWNSSTCQRQKSLV